MSTPTIQIYKWLYSLFSADATLMAMLPGGLHPHRADPGDGRPCLTYYAEALPNDGYSFPTKRLISRYEVEIVVRADVPSAEALEDIADRVDFLMQSQPNNFAAGILHQYRVQAIDEQTSYNNLAFYHLGGSYEVWYQEP